MNGSLASNSNLHPTVIRAQYLWPRLDRRMLAHSQGNPARIADHVARRTSLPVDTIIELLLKESLSSGE
jgi:hypothetical protein